MVCLTGFWLGVFAVVGALLALGGIVFWLFVWVEMVSHDPDLP